MSDRVQVLIAVPRDPALPVDVQGVGLRRRAIDLMGELAVVNESTVRYQGGTEDATINFGGDVGQLALWQVNGLAARFTADGDSLKTICGPVTHKDQTTRVYSVASVVRDR